jgi:hypothetical protein
MEKELRSTLRSLKNQVIPRFQKFREFGTTHEQFGDFEIRLTNPSSKINFYKTQYLNKQAKKSEFVLCIMDKDFNILYCSKSFDIFDKFTEEKLTNFFANCYSEMADLLITETV